MRAPATQHTGRLGFHPRHLRTSFRRDKGYESKLEISASVIAAGEGKQPPSICWLQPRVSTRSGSITIVTPKADEIVVTGIDKQRSGSCAEIRGFRPPEPYKGKGVKYADEHIFRKEGKKK